MIEWLFSRLIKLYPRRFRASFEDELNTVFAAALDDARAGGFLPVLGLCLRELYDFPISLVCEHYDEREMVMKKSLSVGWFILKLMMLVFLVPFIVASLCNFSQWNYWFTPPPLNPLVEKFASVDSLGYYDLDPDDTALGYYAINGDVEIGARSFSFIDDDRARVPQWAQTQGVADISPLSDSWLDDLPHAIVQAGWPVEFLRGYNDAPYYLPVGYVVQGTDHNGDPLVLISMARVIRDDHYGIHEGLFRSTNNRLVLLESNSYNYDSAGMEFAQWPFWFTGATVLWWIGLLLVSGVRNLVRQNREKLAFG